MLMKFTDVDVLQCLNWSYSYSSTLKQRPFIPVFLIVEGVLNDSGWLKMTQDDQKWLKKPINDLNNQIDRIDLSESM